MYVLHTFDWFRYWSGLVNTHTCTCTCTCTHTCICKHSFIIHITFLSIHSPPSPHMHTLTHTHNFTYTPHSHSLTTMNWTRPYLQTSDSTTILTSPRLPSWPRLLSESPRYVRWSSPLTNARGRPHHLFRDANLSLETRDPISHDTPGTKRRATWGSLTQQ